MYTAVHVAQEQSYDRFMSCVENRNEWQDNWDGCAAPLRIFHGQTETNPYSDSLEDFLVHDYTRSLSELKQLCLFSVEDLFLFHTVFLRIATDSDAERWRVRSSGHGARLSGVWRHQ